MASSQQDSAALPGEPSIEQHDFASPSATQATSPPAMSDSAMSSPTPPARPHLETSVLPESLTRGQCQTPSVQSSYSATSDRQLGHGSQADPSDRVFPIRSVVSVDPTSRSSTDQSYFPRMSSDGSGIMASRPSHPRHETETPVRRQGSIASDSILSPFSVGSPPAVDSRGIRRRTNTTGARSSVQADAERQGSVPLSLFANDASDEEESEPAAGPYSAPQSSIGRDPTGAADAALDGLMTTRFKHVTTDDGHLVITGRDGTLQRCEDEPIHTPGAVQGFGLLMAIREEVDGRFTVRYVSENSKRIIGYSPLQLFRLNNFTDILTEEQADNLLDHIDFIRDEDADPAINGPEVFSMSIRPPKKRCVFDGVPRGPFPVNSRALEHFSVPIMCCQVVLLVRGYFLRSSRRSPAFG